MKLLLQVSYIPFATKSLKNSYIRLLDGTGTPVVMTVKIGEGNATYSEKIEREYKLDRGNIDDVVDGDDQPIDVSLDFTWDYVTGEGGELTTTSDDIGTVEDFLKAVGPYAANVTSDAITGSCASYAVDIKIVDIPNCAGTGYYCEIIDLPNFRYEELAHDLSAGTVACTGRCNAVVAIATRALLAEAQAAAGLT